MELVEHLLAAKDKVMDGWCQGHRAETADGVYQEFGEFLKPRDPRAAKWCMVGAIEAVEGGPRWAASFGATYSFVEDYMQAFTPYSWAPDFNDARGRTQAQVVGMFDEIIAYAKELQ